MTKNTVSRKSLSAIVLYAAENGCTIWDAADALGFDPEGTRKAITDFDAAMHRPRKSKPSAETLKNAAIMRELVEELNARGKEMTATELADVYTDPEGNVLNPRKVGAALARAAREGLIAKSPEKWSVAHYAPHGVEFAPKPKRMKKSEQTDASDSEQSDAQDTPEDVTEE